MQTGQSVTGLLCLLKKFFPFYELCGRIKKSVCSDFQVILKFQKIYYVPGSKLKNLFFFIRTDVYI